MKTLLVRPILTCLLCLTAIFLFPSGEVPAQLVEREIRRGIMDNPVRLDPHFAALAPERAILADLYIGLVTENAAGQIEPGAAESWEVRDDGMTWVFKLRAGQNWSDGRPLVAGDFEYAFRRLLAPQSGALFASMFYNIEGAEILHKGRDGEEGSLGVTATDDATLVFRLTHRSPQFLAQLVHHSAYPLREDQVERADESWTRPGKMVTNGPYILSEWLPGNYLKLSKNWRFFDPASVTMDHVYYDVVEFIESATERFFSGTLHTLSGVPRDAIAGLMEQAPEVVRIHPSLTVDYLVINTRKPPFNDPRVREALALAVDSPTLVRRALDGGEIPADGLLPDGLAGVREPEAPPRKGPFPIPRPLSAREKRDAAKLLLTDAGFGVQDTLRLTLHYNANGAHQKVAETVAEMWKRVGVRTDLYSNDYVVHYGDLGLGEFDVARAGWVGDFNDPAAFLMLWDSESERFNYGRFKDAEFEKLMTTAARQEPAAREVTLHRAEQLAMKRFPIIPLYQHASRNLVATNVVGWEDNVRDLHPSRYLDLTD
ncbi:MAG: peptide ABC transporter substrate-binding protein [Rhodospirillales bacterium]|nr:MAG: peptide ABC transporter substrate-binding protein [Rhodospirillales bacterium]